MATSQNSPHGVPTSPGQDEAEGFALTQINDVFSPNLSVEELGNQDGGLEKTEVTNAEVTDTTKSVPEQEATEKENEEVAAISQVTGATSGTTDAAMEAVTKPALLAGVPIASSTPVSEGTGTPNASVSIAGDQARGVGEAPLFDDSTDAMLSSNVHVNLTEPLTVEVSTSADTSLGKPVSGTGEEQIVTGFKVAGIDQVVPDTGAKPVFDSSKGALTFATATKPSTQVVKVSGNQLPVVRVPAFQPTHTSTIGASSSSITVLTTSATPGSGSTTKTCECLLVVWGFLGLILMYVCFSIFRRDNKASFSADGVVRVSCGQRNENAGRDVIGGATPSTTDDRMRRRLEHYSP